MLNAVFCAKKDNLPELTVALSSFVHHNPSSRVFLFCDAKTDMSAVSAMLSGIGVDATVQMVRHRHVELAALDYMTAKEDIDRILLLGDNTLTQGSLDEIDQSDMKGGEALAMVASIWPFWQEDVRSHLYRMVNFDRDESRGTVNTNYFSTSMIVLSLNRLRQINRTSFCIWGSIMSDRSSDDVINHTINHNEFMYMPTRLTALMEVDICDYVDIGELAQYANAISKTKVVQFPEGAIPWGAPDRMDRVCMQVPMASYLEATERVQALLPEDFTTAVRRNAELHTSYFGDLVRAATELRAISDSMGQ